jgi:hypothetical protein
VDALCSLDLITSISRLVQEARQNLGVRLDPRHLRIDFKSDKKYREMADEYFQKRESAKTTADMDMDDELQGSVQSRKAPELVQIEEEYGAFTRRGIVLRRGR